MFVANGLSGNLTTSGTSQRVDISSADAETGAIRLMSEAGRSCVVFGDSSVVAVAPNDMWLAPNFPEIFKIPAGCTHFAVISYGGASALSYTIGQIE